MFGDLTNLPEEDQQRMSSMRDQLQTRDRYFFIFTFYETLSVCL